MTNVAMTFFALIIGITQVPESEKDKIDRYNEFQIDYRPRLEQHHYEHDCRHCTTCPDSGILRVGFVFLVRRQRRKKDGHDIEHHKFGGGENALLDFASEEKQRKHIEKKVSGVGVNECMADKPVQLGLVLLHLVWRQHKPVETLPVGKTKQGENDSQCNDS